MSKRFAFEGPVEVIAHRGYSARAPENTLAALELALEVGAPALEFDLHPASDGTPHLFHDADLERTTDGTGPFEARTPAELARLDAGSWFDARFAGEPVPTLADALARVGTRAARIYPEIKAFRTLDDVDAILDTTVEAGVLDRVVFISMAWEALEHIRARSPEAGIGYIVERRRRTDDALRRAAADPHALVDFDRRILLADGRIAARAAEVGVPLATWTVDRIDEAERLVEMGVRRLTTNRVESLLEWAATL